MYDTVVSIAQNPYLQGIAIVVAVSQFSIGMWSAAKKIYKFLADTIIYGVSAAFRKANISNLIIAYHCSKDGILFQSVNSIRSITIFLHITMIVIYMFITYVATQTEFSHVNLLFRVLVSMAVVWGTLYTIYMAARVWIHIRSMFSFLIAVRKFRIRIYRRNTLGK